MGTHAHGERVFIEMRVLALMLFAANLTAYAGAPLCSHKAHRADSACAEMSASPAPSAPSVTDQCDACPIADCHSMLTCAAVSSITLEGLRATLAIPLSWSPALDPTTLGDGELTAPPPRPPRT